MTLDIPDGERSMLQVLGISKSFPNQPVLEDATFNVAPGEKVGLVGRNGSGKSTLLRIITGELTPDSGTVSMPKHYRIGFLEQRIRFEARTVVGECLLGLPEEARGNRWEAEKVLFGLGFDAGMLERSPAELSGGFQVRLNLAKLLVSRANVLLLDEPTNYLDIISIRWLKKFLRELRSEFILITHDREFMDDVCTHIVAIHRRKARKMQGNTGKMYEQIARDEAVYEKTRQNDEKERKRIEDFITHYRAKARLASRVQSRVKKLEKMSVMEKLASVKDLDFYFNYTPYPSKFALETKGLTFRYEGTDGDIVHGFDFVLRTGEKVAVIGKNGKGKSTLARLIVDELTPVSGEIKPYPGLKIGYFGQTNKETLTPHLTVEEEILKSLPEASREKARDIAAAMLFEGEMSQKKVAVLSGGEKARLMLGKIIAAPCQLLVLDEPTNHLDMQACDALLEALDNFDGSVLIVTHNELFLRSIPERLIVFDAGKLSVFDGTYDDFLERVGWEDEVQAAKELEPKSNNKKEIRKRRAEILEERSKDMNPLKKRMDELESGIGRLEAEQKTLEIKLVEASSAGDGAVIAEAGKAFKEHKEQLDRMYDELSGLTEKYESLEAVYAKKLEGLD